MTQCLPLSPLQCNVSTCHAYKTCQCPSPSLPPHTDSPDVTSQNPTSVQALPGTNVTLSCDFTGVPSPDVTWSHDGVVTAPGQGVAIVTRGNRSEFTVQGVTGERGGVYRCSVSNSIGSGSFNFTVESE